MSDTPENRQEQRVRYLVFIILLVGAGLRFWNLSWGLPNLYEEAFPFRGALSFWKPGSPSFDFNPHFFNYPGLLFYVTFGVQGIVYIAGYLTGTFADVAMYLGDTNRLILMSRTLSVLFDCGTIWMVYLTGRRISSELAGIAAAAFLALNPVAIEAAHQITVDVPLAFFTALTFYFLFRLISEPGQKWYFLSGAAIGLAASAKYTGAFLYLIFILAIVIRFRGGVEGNVKRIILGAIKGSLAAVVVFFCFNPYIFLSYAEFRKDIDYEQFHMAYGHLGLDPVTSTISFYFLETLPRAFGWMLLICGVVGIIWGIIRRSASTLILVVFTALSLIIVTSWAMRADRYLIPVFPAVAILAALGCVEVAEAARKKFNAPMAKVSRLFVAILILPLIGPILTYQKMLTLPDTRTVAREWITSHCPRNAAIATGPAGVELPEGMYVKFQIPFSPTISENLYPFYDTRWYEDLDLVIATDVDYARFVREPQRFGGMIAYFDTLKSGWTAALRLDRDDLHTGPAIWLYKYPGTRRDTFPGSMLRSLATIEDTSLIREFAEGLAYTHFLKGRYTKSDQLLTLAMGYEPGNLRMLRELIWTRFKEGIYAGNIPVIRQALSIDSTQQEVMAILGSSLLHAGQPDAAEGLLLKALEVNRTLDFAYTDLAQLYHSRHDGAKEKAILQRYMAILPQGSDEARRVNEMLKEAAGRK
jgi:4-amino-4-deoxy-L-arabinose transferase-like glycosyltransferase